MMGHLLGAAGGVEAGICALALRAGKIPPTRNLDALDPALAGLGLDFVPHTARDQRIDVALSNSFGFGGTNAALLFGRV
jgi:3-oxoacyl-[acyl-carrier-protein] synthase II